MVEASQLSTLSIKVVVSILFASITVQKCTLPGPLQNAPDAAILPFISAITGFSSTVDYLGPGNSNYASIGAVKETLPSSNSPLASPSNAFTTATKVPRNSESAICSIVKYPTSLEIKPQWMNSDSSKPTIYIGYTQDVLVITGTQVLCTAQLVPISGDAKPFALGPSTPISVTGTLAAMTSLFIQVVQALEPALGICQQIQQEVDQVQFNKSGIGHLVQRCRVVIEAVDEPLSKIERWGDAKVDGKVDLLMTRLRSIHQFVYGQARLSFLKALLRRDQIGRAVTDHHQGLTECLTSFQVSEDNPAFRYQEDLSSEWLEDQGMFEAEFRRIKGKDNMIINRLELLDNQLEAMMALQNSLSKHPNERNFESKILQAGLGALQRATGKMLSSTCPPWIITSFEVDVESKNVLGESGFGIVRKGTWNGVMVAVKEARRGINKKLLFREFQAWSNMTPNDYVAPLFGASIIADLPFLVSLYMSNGNIMQYLEAHPNANRAQFAQDIALGMRHLHSQNVIHGDLKPPNVLIKDDKKACITDFGLANIRQVSSLYSTTASTQRPGALRFMAPEVFHGDRTKASDVYAFGMTLYEIYLGTTPFLMIPDEVVLDMRRGHYLQLTRPTDNRTVNRGLTDAAWNLIIKTCDPMPTGRPDFETIETITERLVDERHTAVLYGHAVQEYESRDTDEFLGFFSEIPITFPTSHSRLILVNDDWHLVKALEGHTKKVRAFAFSPTGELLASVSDDRTVRTWNAISGAPVAVMNSHENHVSCVAFSPDGSLLASGSDDRTVRVWSVAAGHVKGRPIVTLLEQSAEGRCVETVAFSPDGSRLASINGDPHIRMWDTTTWGLVALMRGHSFSVATIAFSPDSRRLVSGSMDKVLRIYDAAFAAEVMTIKGENDFKLVVISPNGRLIASTGTFEPKIFVWDTASGASVSTVKIKYCSVHCIAFSPNSKRFASAWSDKKLRIWDAMSGELVCTMEGHTDKVNAIAFSPSGSRLASGSDDNTLRIWDTSSGRSVATLVGHSKKIKSVAFSSDGGRLVSGSNDFTLRIWEAGRTVERKRDIDSI